MKSPQVEHVLVEGNDLDVYSVSEGQPLNGVRVFTKAWDRAIPRDNV